MLMLYVDDIILTCSNVVKIQFVIDDLAAVFYFEGYGKTFISCTDPKIRPKLTRDYRTVAVQYKINRVTMTHTYNIH